MDNQELTWPDPGNPIVLTALTSPRRREVVRLHNKNYRLTDIGIRRVLTEVADKLVI